MQLFVPESVNLVIGQAGYFPVTVKNTGTLALAFKDYDPANPVGGYGWNFNDPGLAVGFGGVIINNLGLMFDYGMVPGIVPDADLTGSYHHPDLSFLNGVSIRPGESFSFTVFTFLLSTGSSNTFRSALQLDLGSPLYAGWQGGAFTVAINRAATFSTGPLHQVNLTEFSFAPVEPPPPSVVPEFPSLAIWSLLAVVAMTIAWRLQLQKENPAV